MKPEVPNNKSRHDLIDTNKSSGLSAEELKELLTTLRNNLKDDLNKVIETKLQEQSNILSSKIDITEAHIAYTLRLPTPPPGPALSTSSSSHRTSPTSTSSAFPKNLKENLGIMLRSQFSLNTVLLIVIIYLLLSIVWML